MKNMEIGIENGMERQRRTNAIPKNILGEEPSRIATENNEL